MKYHVLINPAAAGGRTKKVRQIIEPVFRQKDIPYDVRESEKDYGMDRIIRDLEEKEDNVHVIVIGGDGTMNDLVSGITDFAHTEVGYIPCGSGGDMLRDMNLKKDPLWLVNRILEDHVYHTADVGEVKVSHWIDLAGRERDDVLTRRFNVSAGIGLDAGCCEKAQGAKHKKALNRAGLGSLVYLIGAFQQIKEKNRFGIEMTLNGHTVKREDAVFISFHNHKYEGGGFRFAPGASYEDGMLDLCEVYDYSIPAFLNVFVHALNGSHVYLKDHIRTDRTGEVHVRCGEPVWFHTDGEVYGKCREIDVRVLTEKLRLLI